jgi:hypothetical protein
MKHEGTDKEDKQAELVPRIQGNPGTLAAYYEDLAEQLTEVVARLGAFDRALSKLPIFLFSFGIVVFAAGTVLYFYESLFGSSEFNDMTLFAVVLVVASAAIYIAEIRIRDGADRDKQVVDAAREALAALAKIQNQAVPASPPPQRMNPWNRTYWNRRPQPAPNTPDNGKELP